MWRRHRPQIQQTKNCPIGWNMSAVYMLGELDSYSLPAADKEKLAKIKQAASVPDWETLKRILY